MALKLLTGYTVDPMEFSDIWMVIENVLTDPLAINLPNTDPIATNDKYSFNLALRGRAARFNYFDRVLNVLENDSDAENDLMEIDSVNTLPSNVGTVTIYGNGKLTGF